MGRMVGSIIILVVLAFSTASAVGGFYGDDPNVLNGVAFTILAIVEIFALVWWWMNYDGMGSVGHFVYPIGAVVVPPILVFTGLVVLFLVLAGLLIFGMLVSWLLS